MTHTLFLQHSKMFNLDDITNESSEEHNSNGHIFQTIYTEC